MDFEFVYDKAVAFKAEHGRMPSEARINPHDMNDINKTLASTLSPSNAINSQYKPGFLGMMDATDFYIDESVPRGNVRLA